MTTQLVRISSEVAIPYLTYSGQPVLTFALIDKVHNRVEGTAGRNFRTNRQRFIEREDFYDLDSQSLDEFRRNQPGVIGDAAQHAVFITESGYLMLVKSFTDDLSWQIQRQLVKLYFRVKTMGVPPVPEPTGFAEELIAPAQQAEIRQMACRLGSYFRMSGSGEKATFALIREHFGVQSAYQLPARHFDEAMGVLDWADRQGRVFLLRVVQVEQKFLHSRFRVCPVELDHLADGAPSLFLKP
ncbi:MAG TPA: ORF6N domain-containing protein [Candidatus Contendobacter sp.]|nr:ORF6N domain-containing protein [Candidatus Contendobacter sp.]